MNNNTFSRIIIVIVLLILQIFIFNNIHLFGFINPYIYLLGLLLLPLELPKSLQYIIAFIIGFIIDIFSRSYGIHASACLTMIFIRPFIVKLLNGRRTTEGIDKPIPGVKDFKWLLTYTLFLVFVHHFMITFLECFSFHGFGMTLISSILSTIFTAFLILCIEYTFIPVKKQ